MSLLRRVTPEGRFKLLLRRRWTCLVRCRWSNVGLKYRTQSRRLRLDLRTESWIRDDRLETAKAQIFRARSGMKCRIVIKPRQGQC